MAHVKCPFYLNHLIFFCGVWQTKLSFANNSTSAKNRSCLWFSISEPFGLRYEPNTCARACARACQLTAAEGGSGGDILDSWVNGDHSLKHRIRGITRSFGQNRTQLPVLSRSGRVRRDTDTDTQRWVRDTPTAQSWHNRAGLVNLVSLTS